VRVLAPFRPTSSAVGARFHLIAAPLRAFRTTPMSRLLSTSTSSDEHLQLEFMIRTRRDGEPGSPVAMDSIQTESLRALRHVPGWENVREDEVGIQRICGAMTNVIFACRARRDGVPAVLLRVYGTGSETFIERKKEIELFKSMCSAGYADVQLLHEFANGRCESFLEGYRALTIQEMRTEEIAEKVAARMWNMHLLDVPGERTNVILTTIAKWHPMVIERCTDAKFAPSLEVRCNVHATCL
jgi:hypothetical protein